MNRPADLMGDASTNVTLAVKLPPDQEYEELSSSVDDLFGPDWQVESLFEDDEAHPQLSRWFTIDGPAQPDGASVIQQTWEAAHRLQARGQYEIEPQVPKGTYQPSSRIEWGGICPPGPDLPGSSGYDWALENIRAIEAWGLEPHPTGARRGQGIVIGHPDTGYTMHEELYPDSLDLARDRDVLDSDDDALDPLLAGNPGHGTSTGVVIASREAGQLAGAAPMATLRPIRSIKSVVVFKGAPIASAINFARISTCDVVSMSLGGLFLESIRDSLNAAVAEGMIVLAAAGNCWPNVADPAHFLNCIAVAATNANDEPWQFTASGDRVAISAPGESVWTADVAQGIGAIHQSSGTSFAVAHVAGVAALWLAHHGRDKIRRQYGGGTSAVFRQIVRATARVPNMWDVGNMGAGIVDASAALQAPLPPPLPSAVEEDEPGPYPRSGQAVLGEVAAGHPAAPLGQLPQVQAALEGAGETREQRELLYREYVYHLTESPVVGAAMAETGSEEVLDSAIENLASPTLAAALGARYV